MPSPSKTRRLIEDVLASEVNIFDPVQRFTLLEQFAQLPQNNADIVFTSTDGLSQAELILIQNGNPNFKLQGANTPLCAYSANGGVRLTTGGTSGNHSALFPRVSGDATSLSAWWTTQWLSQKEPIFDVTLVPLSAAAVALSVGFSARADFDTNTKRDTSANFDADDGTEKFWVRYATDGAVSASQWTACQTVGSVDTETLISAAPPPVADTPIRIRIALAASRQPMVFVNGLHVFTSTTQMANAVELVPLICVQTKTTGTKALEIKSAAISRLH